MGNTKNKKVPKKRKASNKSKCKKSSDQKENDDGLAMSRQLLLKKTNARLQRRFSSRPERVCPNGKLIPSLSELEKMYEDSDDDDKTPNTPTQKPTCTTSTPEKRTPTNIKNLSPTTINKITERLLGSIHKQNLPDPSEVLEATLLLRAESPPPTPIIPPKKRKKPEVPYIVGCKDRPKVIRKPNTNFCKGDDDYGVEASGEDPEEQTTTKRAKKSRIPNYSKSIFNAHSDEIAERLAKDDVGGLSDASSDSNKTIKYDPMSNVCQSPRPHLFSPLPSTSTDSETIKKNDELFNDSLKEITITKESLPKVKNDVQISNEIMLEKEEKEHGILIAKQLTPIKKKDDIQIIDIPCDTIVIEDICDETVGKQNTSNAIDTDDIEIIEPVGLEVAKPKQDITIHNIHIDDDCMIISSSETINTHNKPKLDEPIIIDDEYSTINMDFDSFKTESIEIIDVDNIIAENKSILDKWKNDGAKELNKINTVVDVPTTYRNVTTLHQGTPKTTLQAGVTPSTTLQTTSTPNPNNDLNMTNRDSATNSLHNQRQRTSVSNTERTVTFQSILDDFFEHRQNSSTGGTLSPDQGNGIERFFRSMISSFRTPRPTSNSFRVPSSPVNTVMPVSTNTFQTVDNSQRDLVESSNSSSHSGTQQTSMAISPPSSVASRNIGDCPICLDPLSSSNGIASTICGHVFCLKCIQASVKTNGKKCPTCRKALKGAGGGYHQLYL